MKTTRVSPPDDLILDSLWLLGRRDASSVHTPEYWGNFVPQIPNQVLRRFTQPGEVVVDLFCGLGTTLIECRRLGRHGIGVELVPHVARRAQEVVEQAENPYGVHTVVLEGLDACEPSTAQRVRDELHRLGLSHAHCLILHPPYHDIIKFSDDPRDLSRAPTVKAFLDRFAKAVANAVDLLAPGRHLALVIGDKYTRGEWVPLGFYCMEVCRKAGLRLKAINVKDIQGNERGKGKTTNLWRYRALRGGFYIFRHEYVMLFQKKVTKSDPLS
ncbi:MAG: site-specific DNA-methyltransferase [Dehalococcoidia bacterium]|nr:site-specific DNA-methyltransferase [Dehalococcoidia bacterium]MDW8120651.1 DNA methyltransferase [Chloroflexota bacterium]